MLTDTANNLDGATLASIRRFVVYSLMRPYFPYYKNILVNICRTRHIYVYNFNLYILYIYHSFYIVSTRFLLVYLTFVLLNTLDNAHAHVNDVIYILANCTWTCRSKVRNSIV